MSIARRRRIISAASFTRRALSSAGTILRSSRPPLAQVARRSLSRVPAYITAYEASGAFSRRSSSVLSNDSIEWTFSIPVRRAASGPGPSFRPVHCSCDGSRGGRNKCDSDSPETSGRDQEPRVRCFDPRQVEEVVVLTEVVVLQNVHLDVAGCGRRHDHDPRADPFRQRGPTRLRGLDVDRPARAWQLRDGRRGRARESPSAWESARGWAIALALQWRGRVSRRLREATLSGRATSFSAWEALGSDQEERESAVGLCKLG